MLKVDIPRIAWDVLQERWGSMAKSLESRATFSRNFVSTYVSESFIKTLIREKQKWIDEAQSGVEQAVVTSWMESLENLDV